MADTTPASTPALPSTADPLPYVPVSWMAVAALTVAALFVGVLLVLGVSAYLGKKPLILPELLVLAVVGMVLSFAGRRMIRNSEGTRTGDKLADTAWWVSVVAGLGYTAYLFAIEYSIRRDAEAEIERWVGWILKADPVELDKAFIRTLPPGRRVGLSASNPAQLQAEFGDQYVAFGQVDLVRLAKRSPGLYTFVPLGLKDWSYRPSGIECVFAGVVKGPEGSFPVEIFLKGVEGGVGSDTEVAGRQWAITAPQSGFVLRDKLSITPYGWLLTELDKSGSQIGQKFVEGSRFGPPVHYSLYHEHMRPRKEAAFWERVAGTIEPLMALAGGPAMMLPLTAGYSEYFRDQAFKLPGGAEPTTEQKARFVAGWNGAGLGRPGARIPKNDTIDAQNLLTVTDDAVELRMPCEVLLEGVAGDSTGAARGRLLLVCTDPDVLAELKKLQAESNPDQGTSSPPTNQKKRAFNWRVVRVESNLQEVKVNTRGGPGGPPGGGMPGGPG